MDQQQQCGRTVVCSSSSNTNNIISSSVMMQQQQSSPSSPSPSSSPPSSPSSSMDMANHQNMLFVHNNNNNNMAGAASARVFSNPSPYHFMMNTSISALPPPPPSSDPMITTPSTTMNPLPPPSTNSTMSMRAKIMSHPHFPRLLSAYSNCHKVGAPPDVAARLEEVCGAGATAAVMAAARSSSSSTGNGNYSSIGEDPALDQFMEAYCEMLTKYEQELSKPFKEAMLFLSRIESQFRALTLNNNSSPNSTAGSGGGDFAGRNNGSSEDDMDALDTSYIDPQAEDKELKVQLLRRYSGYLGNLKQEFLKKKKKGKLPKEARQQLLEWWNRHYKWPYPSESQKVALAEATGLDQKQINNWFINQRKRHWKPTEDMQFVVMDAAYPHHYYLENGVGMGSSTNAFPLDFNSSNSHHL